MDETAVCVKPDNAVVVSKPQEEPSKSKKKILDEEEYIEVIFTPHTHDPDVQHFRFK